MDINIKRLKLKNGIRVIIVPLKTKLTYISTNFLLGRYQEKEDEMGLTHYCEHLLGRLTSQKYKDATYISDEIFKRGGMHNARVYDYEMELYISGLFVDLEFYMDILSNTISKFYVENDIKIKEKGAVVQELMTNMSGSNYKFNFNMFKFLYPKYSYIVDYKKQIQYIKHFDNKKISQFIKSHLNTDNLVVTITCPSNKVGETIKNVKKYFGIIKKKKSRFVYPELKNHNKNLQIVNIKNDNINSNNSIILQISKRIEFLSEEHLILSYYIRHILFNFDSGIFYNILRKELGIIYGIGLYVNIDNYNPNMSYYNISSRCQDVNMPLFIEKFIEILKTYDINDVYIMESKKHFKYIFENKKFFDLTSYNDKYKDQLLFYKDIVKSKDILKKILSIKSSSIKDYFNNVFVKDILSNHTLFYYSNKNINKDIEMIYKKNISNAKYKSYYIS